MNLYTSIEWLVDLVRSVVYTVQSGDTWNHYSKSIVMLTYALFFHHMHHYEEIYTPHLSITICFMFKSLDFRIVKAHAAARGTGMWPHLISTAIRSVRGSWRDWSEGVWVELWKSETCWNFVCFFLKPITTLGFHCSLLELTWKLPLFDTLLLGLCLGTQQTGTLRHCMLTSPAALASAGWEISVENGKPCTVFTKFRHFPHDFRD